MLPAQPGLLSLPPQPLLPPWPAPVSFPRVTPLLCALRSSWMVWENHHHNSLYTHTPCSVSFSLFLPSQPNYPPWFLGQRVHFFIPAHRYPPRRSGGQGWLGRSHWGEGKSSCWESPGRRGPSRGLKAQSFLGARGRGTRAHRAGRGLLASGTGSSAGPGSVQSVLLGSTNVFILKL